MTGKWTLRWEAVGLDCSSLMYRYRWVVRSPDGNRVSVWDSWQFALDSLLRNMAWKL